MDEGGTGKEGEREVGIFELGTVEWVVYRWARWERHLKKREEHVQRQQGMKCMAYPRNKK